MTEDKSFEIFYHREITTFVRFFHRLGVFRFIKKNIGYTMKIRLWNPLSWFVIVLMLILSFPYALLTGSTLKENISSIWELIQ